MVSSKAERNRIGFFADLYRQVTLRIKQWIEEGRFDDGVRMEAFTVQFGKRYFAALDAYRQALVTT